MDIKEILRLHKLWLENNPEGERADLSGADLRVADLRGADLRRVNLRRVNLRGADLSDAYLSGADLSDADLSGAVLSGADLSDAYLRGADLRRVNLSDADLRRVNLSGADLWDCIGNGKEIKTVQTSAYTVTYTKDVMQIGCKHYTWEEWCSFDDNTIQQMDNQALEWWKVWKPILLLVMEAS
jgi:hypothetical protein